MTFEYRSLRPYKYQLVKPYRHTLDKPRLVLGLGLGSSHVRVEDGTLLLGKGYAWDGPSGPTFDTATFMRGSLVHDAMYQLIRLGVLSIDNRLYADELLRDVCVEDGMNRLRAWYVYWAVRFFGWVAV